jgi:ketosteroid isomerase-like protein
VSTENVELVQRLYEAWARHEIPGPDGLLDPDIEYVNPDGAIESGTRRGLPAFATAVEKLFEGREKWVMEPELFFDAGDRVGVVIRYRAKARKSGVEVSGRESALLTIRDGKISRYEWFHAPGDALEVVGLQE